MDTDAYLARIGYAGPREPSLDVLRALHEAHLFAVPFETLSIHSGETIRLDEDWLFDKLVVRRRGGFCYELNGGFAALLDSLGFRVQRLAARVYKPDGELGIPFDHMALRVDLDEPWLADVGFGDCFFRPLRLGTEELQRDEFHEYRIAPNGDALDIVEHRAGREPKPQYRLELDARELADFEPGCAHHQSSPESPFTRRAVCSILRRTGRVTVSGRSMIFTTHSGAKVTFPLPDDGAARDNVRVHFGIDLDVKFER
jgi:N-hydroxyarylamine O-acetyltransferase